MGTNSPRHDERNELKFQACVLLPGQELPVTGSRSRGATTGTGMLAGARACRCLHHQPPALQSSPIPWAGSESGAGTLGWPYPGTTSPVIRTCPPCQVLLSAPLLTTLKLVNEQTGFFFITNFSPYKSAVKAQLGRLLSSTLLRRPGRSLAGSLHILGELSSLLGTTCPGDQLDPMRDLPSLLFAGAEGFLH